MADEKRWLDQVLEDATSEVRSWPNWLKDAQSEAPAEKQSAEKPKLRAAAAGNGGTERQSVD
jgi:hypothetical protein